jgi:hypothetical protein
MYFVTVSMFAPPVVDMKYPIFQKASLQSFFLISGLFFFNQTTTS